MRGEKRGAERGRRGERNRHSVDRPRSRDSRCKKRELRMEYGTSRDADAHTLTRQQDQGEAMRKNKQWRSENHKPRFVGLFPHRRYCVWRRERWGGRAKRHASRFYGHFFLSFCARTWLFAPTCCYDYASMCFQALFVKNGVRRTEYVLLRSAITSASAQYGRQKKKTV